MRYQKEFLYLFSAFHSKKKSTLQIGDLGKSSFNIPYLQESKLSETVETYNMFSLWPYLYMPERLNLKCPQQQKQSNMYISSISNHSDAKMAKYCYVIKEKSLDYNVVMHILLLALPPLQRPLFQILPSDQNCGRSSHFYCYAPRKTNLMFLSPVPMIANQSCSVNLILSAKSQNHRVACMDISNLITLDVWAQTGVSIS